MNEIDPNAATRRRPEYWTILEALAARLGASKDVLGVIVFGSLARGSDTPSSDVDLIVLLAEGTDRGPISSVLRKASADTPLANKLTPIYFTPSSLSRELAARPSFGGHLADEGVVLYRTPALDALDEQMEALTPLNQRALEEELQDRTRLLEKLGHLERMNGEFLPTLSQLYTLARSVIIVKLMQRGVRKYDWGEVFDAYSKIEPSLAGEIATLKNLRGYYEFVHDRGASAPDRRRADRAAVESAMDAVVKVARS
ncbi:nucleotidyltransferase family protein [Pedococcus sp. 5OH_020]|uniref:nucleotidyltransferase family protein n=1 Tax=Pedococcus sp. 5OH_020 TaxID=2989814 RepID=UPI0022EA0361|nr:nucleotidyltransferase domain-containing protein [Pedococcus sp. 5OH_020]